MCWDYLYPGFTVFKNHEPSIHHPAGHWSRLSGWLNFSSASSRKAWLWSCLVARKPAILIFLLLWDLTYQIWDITFYQIYIYIYICIYIYIWVPSKKYLHRHRKTTIGRSFYSGTHGFSCNFSKANLGSTWNGDDHRKIIANLTHQTMKGYVAIFMDRKIQANLIVNKT